MTISEMKQQKKLRGYSNKIIAARSGVPLGTVQKIFAGITESPRMETLLALEKAFSPGEGRTQFISERNSGKDEGENVYVSEGMAKYGVKHYTRQGKYTIHDYYEMPEDHRVELIDGVFYDMSSPLGKHQKILGELFVQIHDYIRKHNGSCQVFPAPFDVQLDMDDRTIVQPDIVVICDRNRINRRGAYGAPDFIIEILSPSTSYRDNTIKLFKYLQAGVREYWIVDPDNQKIFAYKREGESVSMQIYSFDEYVPVGIWGNQCRIDFPDIREQVRDWPE